jgi:glycine hydroxymethyltransferase
VPPRWRTGARWSRPARGLEAARLLACGIGLPLPEVAGDVNGLRLGVPEIVRLGFEAGHMGELAALLAAALASPEGAAAAAPEVSALRRRVARGPLRHVRA